MPEQTDPAPEVTATPAAEPASSEPPALTESSAPEGLTSMADALKGFEDMGLSPTADITDKPSRPKPADKPADKPAAKPQPPVEHQFQPDQNARATKLAAIKDPTDRERLKAMSNTAFEKYYKLTLDLQNGDLVPKSKIDEAVAAKAAEFESQKKDALSSRYFDHEEGYRLTPEYRQAESEMTQLNQERSFWNSQLSNVRAGRPFRVLELDEKGKPRPSADEYDPKDPEAEGHLIGKITQATTMIEDRRRAMQTLPSQHKEMHTKFTGIVSKMDKDIFGSATAPAFLAKVDTQLSLFPAPLRSRPEIQLIAKALAGGEILLERINALTASQTKNGNVSKSLATSAPAPLETATAAGSEDSTTSAVRQLDKIAASAGSYY